MLFSSPNDLESSKGNPSSESEEASSKELHLIARDTDGSLYGLTIAYLLLETNFWDAGVNYRFMVDRYEMNWLFRELNGDRLTHYRKGESKKQTYRPIGKALLNVDEIAITSYYSKKPIAIDFTD